MGRFNRPLQGFKLKLMLEFDTCYWPASGGTGGRRHWTAKWVQHYLTEADLAKAIEYYRNKKLNRSTRYTMVVPL